jgi:hypothetical protein
LYVDDLMVSEIASTKNIFGIYTKMYNSIDFNDLKIISKIIDNLTLTNIDKYLNNLYVLINITDKAYTTKTIKSFLLVKHKRINNETITKDDIIFLSEFFVKSFELYNEIRHVDVGLFLKNIYNESQMGKWFPITDNPQRMYGMGFMAIKEHGQPYCRIQ